MRSTVDRATTSPLRPQAEPVRRHEPPIRFVEADGSLTASGHEQLLDLDAAFALYRDMLLGRTLDREALSLQRQGELSLWLMAWGQEAAQVGTIRALDIDDMVFPTYREHVAALCRGITPAEILSQWRGCSHGGWNPARYRFHVSSLVLGTQTLHATGYAAGSRLAGDEGIVAVYFGDGATSQGDVNEAFNWAAAANLPVLFICQNNQWAISTPNSQQMKTPVFERAAAFGMPAWHVDGNDVLAVHAVTSAAAAHVRSGAGPALVEAQTYRIGGHSSSDDPQRYRDPAELALWQERDPIARVRQLLTSAGFAEERFDAVEAEAKAFATSVREACLAIPDPVFEHLFDAAYAEPNSVVEADRRQHLELRALLEGAA